MIYTFESGNDSQPAILFLHGGGLSSASWQPVIERLPEFHCLAPDLPGHGHSKELPFHMADAESAAEEIVVRRTAAHRAHVVGLSLGGAVTLSLLRLAPERVDHAMISGSSGKMPRFLTNLGKSMAWIYRFYKPDFLLQATYKEHGIPPEYQPLVAADILAGSQPAFLRGLADELSSWELPEQVERPLLIAVGAKEMKAAHDISRGYLKRYPGARGVLIPGARHAWPLQFPDLFAATVRAWVTNQPLPVELQPFPMK